MATIRAPFDGRVFVPEEPVDLRPGQVVDVSVPGEDSPFADLLRLAEGAPKDADYPPDYAAQIDHYLYGVPKDPKNDPSSTR